MSFVFQCEIKYGCDEQLPGQEVCWCSKWRNNIRWQVLKAINNSEAARSSSTRVHRLEKRKRKREGEGEGVIVLNKTCLWKRLVCVCTILYSYLCEGRACVRYWSSSAWIPVGMLCVKKLDLCNVTAAPGPRCVSSHYIQSVFWVL